MDRIRIRRTPSRLSRGRGGAGAPPSDVRISPWRTRLFSAVAIGARASNRAGRRLPLQSRGLPSNADLEGQRPRLTRGLASGAPSEVRTSSCFIRRAVLLHSRDEWFVGEYDIRRRGSPEGAAVREHRPPSCGHRRALFGYRHETRLASTSVAIGVRASNRAGRRLPLQGRGLPSSADLEGQRPRLTRGRSESPPGAIRVRARARRGPA